MPPRGESGTRKRRRTPPPAPISENSPRMQPRVRPVDKQATIYAAEQNLKPWEVHPPPAPPRRRTLVQPPSRRTTQDERYKAAVAAPVSPRARQQLAGTMTPERKRQYDRTIAPPAPRHDTSLVHAVTSTPGSVAHHLATYLGVAGHVAAAPARSAARTAMETAYGAEQPGPIPAPVRAAAAGAKEPLYGAESLALGPDITRLSVGEHPSKLGLALDVAAILPGTKITRLARAGIEAEIAARGLRGAEKAAAVEKAFSLSMEGQTLPGRVVTAARRSSTLKGPAREEAHRLIDEQVTDPVARRVSKAQYDAHVYVTVKDLPASERRDAASQVYHQLGEAVRNVPEHPVPGFKPVVDDVKAQANVRQAVKAREIFPEVGIRAQNAPQTSAENGVQVVGDISSPDYMNRLNVAVGGNTELGLRLASWYREAMPILRTFFREDADAIMRGFAVSQANASPSGGLAAVLTIRDMLLRGENISRKPNGQTLISTVADSIQKAVQGQEVSKGLAAKLHDFAASLEGRRTRSWTADEIKAGAPVAVDIHALRDVGLVDPKIISTLRDRHGIDVSKLAIDNPQAAAQGLQYELVAEKYRHLTADMNAAKFWGKDNWTPADVQALGWSAIQRIHGTFPEDLMFAVDRNTYEHAVEVLNGKTGMGKGLSYPAQMAVTQEISRLLPQFVRDENGYLRDMVVGPSSWQGGTGVAVNMKIVGSAGQAERIAQRLAKAFDQYDVWAVRTNVSISSRPGAGAGRVAFEIRSESFDSPDAVDRFWQALRRNTPKRLQKHLDGFMPIEREGMKGIRVVTKSGPQAFAKLPDYMEKTWETVVRQSAEEAGLTGRTRYNAVNVELRDAATAGSRTRTVYGGRPARGAGGVGDPLAVEARAALRDAIARHSGVAGSVRRGVAALASERGELNLGAIFSRWAKPDIAHEAAAADRVSEAAQEVMDWHTAHPSADPALRNEMVAQIAEHNGVDLNALRSHLGISPTAEGAAQAVREALPGAKGTYHLQAYQRRQEVARRAGLGAQALEGQEGRAGHYAALHELKGELPQLNWGKFKNFDDEAVSALFSHIRGNPNLRFFEKLRTEQALLRAMEGRVPTPGQIKLLETVFGKQAVRSIRDAVPTITKLKHLGFEIWNVPRSLMASFDLSAPFRQGLMVAVPHPRLFFRNFKSMVRAFGSESVYQSIMEDIATRPTYGLMQRAKLAITDLEDISTREEAFMGGNLAERIPIAGHGVRMSGRAYTGFLNKTRADLFDMLIQKAQAQGRDVVNDEKLLKSVASFVNSATGRGRAGETLEQHMVTLNSLFFSPRLLLSRLNFMNPLYYAHLDPFARREAVKAAVGLASTLAGILYVARLGGAKVATDPRNADFAKIRVNNTRVDMAGGFLPPIRLVAQIEQGKIVSSTTGKTLALSGGFGGMTREDVAKRFFQTKLAPTPSLIDDWFKKTDFEDRPFSWKRAALTRMIPLVAQDVNDLYQQTGNAPLALAAYGVGGLGIGLQTYGPRPVKRRGTTLPPSGGLGGSLGGGLGGSLGGSLGGPP